MSLPDTVQFEAPAVMVVFVTPVIRPSASTVNVGTVVPLPYVPAVTAVLASSDLADIWSYSTRTLTSSAAATAAAVAGSTLTLVNGVTFSATISGLTIPATWSKIYFTAKRQVNDIDSKSILQVYASTDTSAITVFSRRDPTVTEAAYGTLTIDVGAGTIVIAVSDDLDVSALPGIYTYDIKCLKADGSSVQLTGSAKFEILLTETRVTT
jgi:hypothetical protein